MLPLSRSQHTYDILKYSQCLWNSVSGQYRKTVEMHNTAQAEMCIDYLELGNISEFIFLKIQATSNLGFGHDSLLKIFRLFPNFGKLESQLNVRPQGDYQTFDTC